MYENFYISVRKRRGWSKPQLIEEFVNQNYQEDFLAIKNIVGDARNTQCFDTEYNFISNEAAVLKIGHLEEKIFFLEVKKKKIFQSYIELYPEGSFIEEARSLQAELEEELLFNKDQSLSGLKNYLIKFPNGKFTGLAEELFFHKIKSFSDIKEYIAFFPNSRFKLDIEKELYRLLRETENIEIRDYYIKTFPKGRYRKQVTQLILDSKKEEHLFIGAKSIEALGVYLKRYPSGRFHEQAALRYLELCESLEDFLSYQKLFSHKIFNSNIDKAFYDLVVRIKEKEIGMFYLKKFPHGTFVGDVKKLLYTLGPVKFFISYSHEDKGYKDRFVKGLARLTRKKSIDVWQDNRINAGKDFEKEIFTNLNDSEVICLLISPDFIASDYVYSKELKIALERHNKGEAHLIPIILRSTPSWEDESFGRLQALPSSAQPISTWEDQDEAWTNVIEHIGKLVKTLRS